MSNIKWYSLDRILEHNAQYYIIFGERSNGKSYAVDKHIIDNFFLKGEQFGFVKRYEEDIKSKYMSEVFNHLEEYILEEYNHRIKFYRGQWLVYEDGLEGKIAECKVFGYAFSLANVNRTKATSYPFITRILFEEFMSIDCRYLDDEVNLLLNLVSTIGRQRTNLKIFMLANAISKYSPYSSALGIKLHRLKKGDIILKEFKDKKGYRTRFAIERSENVNVFDNRDNVDKIVYNIFGDSGVGQMITSGDFEVHKYKERIDNVTFNEYKMEGDIVINKKDKVPFYIRFEDYYYQIYIKYNTKYVLGFREIDKNKIKEGFLINGGIVSNSIVNINNVVIFNAFNDTTNTILNIIVNCMRLKDFIVLTDDDGENVVNGFRLGGLQLAN